MNKFLIVNPQTGEFHAWFRIKDDWWTIVNCLANNELEEWKLKDNITPSKDNLGRIELSKDFVLKLRGYYSFKNFNTAARKSKELWTKWFAPNALYRVARYFDTDFDGYVSLPISKKEANRIACELNIAVNRYNTICYIEYKIVKQE